MTPPTPGALVTHRLTCWNEQHHCSGGLVTQPPQCEVGSAQHDTSTENTARPRDRARRFSRTAGAPAALRLPRPTAASRPLAQDSPRPRTQPLSRHFSPVFRGTPSGVSRWALSPPLISQLPPPPRPFPPSPSSAWAPWAPASPRCWPGRAARSSVSTPTKPRPGTPSPPRGRHRAWRGARADHRAGAAGHPRPLPHLRRPAGRRGRRPRHRGGAGGLRAQAAGDHRAGRHRAAGAPSWPPAPTRCR